jgi:hypothetical protein
MTSPRLVAAPAGPGAEDAAAVSHLLDRLLPTDAEVEAFCRTNFPQIQWPQCSRAERLRELQLRVAQDDLLLRLRLYRPLSIAVHTDYPVLATAHPPQQRSFRSVPPVAETSPSLLPLSSRKEALLALRGLLLRSHWVAVVGAEGLGKTTLAQQYLRQHQHEFSVVAQLDASTAQSLEHDLCLLARSLERQQLLSLPHAATEQDCLSAAQHFLVSSADWLLLLDPLEITLGELWPPLFAGRLLCTVQTPQLVPPDALPYPLAPLSLGESIQLLSQFSGHHKLGAQERALIPELVAMLGGSPARLLQVARRLREQQLTWIDIVASLRAGTL